MKLKIRKKNATLNLYLMFSWTNWVLECIWLKGKSGIKIYWAMLEFSIERTSSVTSRINLFLQNNVVNDYFLPYVALRCQAERWQEERKVLH